MDLEQFVSDVLSQLDAAVEKVDKSKTQFAINPVNGIDFDVAVTVSSKDAGTADKDASLRVKVVGAGFKLSNSSETALETSSRVKFNVSARKVSEKRAGVVSTKPHKPFFSPDTRY